MLTAWIGDSQLAIFTTGLGLRPDGQPRSRARQPLAISAPDPSPAGRMSSGTAAAGEPPGSRDLSTPIPAAARGDQIHASARVGEADLPALAPRDTLHPRRRVATVLLRLRSLLLSDQLQEMQEKVPGCLRQINDRLPCPATTHGRSWPARTLERPATGEFLLHFLLQVKKQGFPVSPRTLAVTNRGDRIRTCDLVLPKHPRYQAAPRPVGQESSCRSPGDRARSGGALWMGQTRALVPTCTREP